VWYIDKLPEGIIDDSYKTLPYIKEPFNDPTAVKEWIQIYGNIFDTGEMVDYRHPQPEWTQKIIEYTGLGLAGSSYYKMNPGKILPYHIDAYVRYIDYHKLEEVERIHRAIIFLEDWQPGHIFEIDGYPLTNYKSGTIVVWQYDTPHLAANLGTSDRYTLQITGIK